VVTTDRPKCELCGTGFHKRLKRKARYGLTCPGADATEEEREEFKARFEACKYVHQHYGVDAASDPEAVPRIIARRDAALDRGRNPVRENVSPATLQAVATGMTVVVAEESGANRYTRDADFEVRLDEKGAPIEVEVDPPHLTVEGHVPAGEPVEYRWGSGTQQDKADDQALYLSKET
jgi:hypothetical protein